jgi:N-glycosylase/DNA lyase
VLQANSKPKLMVDWSALWKEFGATYVERVTALANDASRTIESELLFCLLGGHGVTFELARSAASVLETLSIFDSSWKAADLELTIWSELSAAQFEPTRQDGSLRRYRYPRRKAHLIARAAAWVGYHAPLREALLAFSEEVSRRDLLCECPGIGLKTASWLLRNVGLANDLAVVDIHVVRALTVANRIVAARLPKDYQYIERCFLAWCEEMDAPPAAFDLMLWEWQRAV